MSFLGSAGNYALLGFAVAIILLSLASQLIVAAKIINFSFSFLLSFQFSYFITLISTFSILTLSLISPLFSFSPCQQKKLVILLLLFSFFSFFVMLIYSRHLSIKFCIIYILVITLKKIPRVATMTLPLKKFIYLFTLII